MIQQYAITIKTIILTALICALLTACSAQTTPEKPGSTEPPEVLSTVEEAPTSSPLPLPSCTPTTAHTATATLPPSPTATNTPTPLPTETETPTPTATPDRVQSGLYSANGCTTIIFPTSALYRVELCVVRIEVDRNGYLLFTVSWTALMPPDRTLTMHSDEGNRNMYLRDELGNRYDHIGVSGSASTGYIFTDNNETTVGSYIFPPAKPGAHTFTFYDDDTRVEIANLVLTNPTIIRQVTDLTWYPFAVEYLLEDWTGATSAEGGLSLTHNEFPTCQLIEWAPGELVGSYKNTIELGPVTYDLYGWNETDWSVREYLAISGLEGITEDVQPFFHLQVPYENSQDCIFDASEVLSSLFEP
jgi:hypothetical protein